MNPKIQKVCEEIEKTKRKLADYQTRLRDLERLKIDFENADIVTLVRDMDISPEQFAALVQAFKAQSDSTAVTPMEAADDSADDSTLP